MYELLYDDGYFVPEAMPEPWLQLPEKPILKERYEQLVLLNRLGGLAIGERDD